MTLEAKSPDTESTVGAAVSRVLTRQADIRLAILFGSAVSDALRRESDIDVAVLAAGRLASNRKAELIGELAAATGRPVDLIDLRAVGEPLLGQILSHGRRLFGSDADYAELLRRHLFDVEDFLPYVERMLAERRRAWIG
jgi:predicted nucleotidyltransferase